MTPPMPWTDPARDLALDHIRVDHRAAVLAHDVPQKLDLPGGTSTSHVHRWVALTQIDPGLVVYR